jgi:hypothetical protein
MYDLALARVILHQIERAPATIHNRFAPVTSPDDFTRSDAGMEKPDAICMQLIALGESVKNLDKHYVCSFWHPQRRRTPSRKLRSFLEG